MSQPGSLSCECMERKEKQSKSDSVKCTTHSLDRNLVPELHFSSQGKKKKLSAVSFKKNGL